MSKKRLRIVSLVVAVVLAVSTFLLAGHVATEQAEADSNQAVISGQKLFNQNDLPHNADSEVYDYLSDIAFGGVSKPNLDSRASIIKALPANKKENLVVGWSAPTQGSTYFAGTKVGAEQQCEKYGYTLKYLAAENFDATQESANIEALVLQKVDVLVVDPADTQANLSDVQRAVAQGIPIIAVGVAFNPDAPVVTTITNNNYWVGFATGQYASKLYKEKITAIDILGQRGHPVSEAEDNGFLAGWVWGKMEQAGNAKVVEDAMIEGFNFFKQLRDNGKVDMSKYNLNLAGSGNGEFIETTGMAVAEDLLTANQDTSLIYAHNDHMGMGAAKVVEERGLQDKIKIVCVSDGDTVGLEAVRDGKLECTGYNSGVMIGKNAIELTHKIFSEGYDANNMPIVSGLPIVVINKDNVGNFIAEGSEYAKEIWIDYKTIDELLAGR
ncbi:MAG: sugar ABC transporter substrate-binding protein [Synergistaceae bacterium]|jgi:ribose transport system substrate-binding protein|nr:sugar ABC transporter substrate-binding protein [Synergistaceae bacterium]